MNERTSRKIPVTERQFLWVQDDDKGEVTLHVGPTMVSPTAADRVQHAPSAIDCSVGIGAQGADPARHGGHGGGAAAAQASAAR